MDRFEDRAATPSYEPVAPTVIFTPQPAIGVYSDPQFQIVRPEGEAPIHFVTALFTCRVSEGKLRGSSEGAAWKCFGVRSLPDRLLAYARHWLDGALKGGPAPVVQ